MSTNLFDESLTLDPPGSIAVVGGGLLGLEACLYGRFLGYDVRLFEAVRLGDSLESDRGNPVPMMPDRCVSPLAVSAVSAQFASAQVDGEAPLRLPTTVDEWLDRWIAGIAATDLLRDRITLGARVVSIAHISVDEESSGQEPDAVDPNSPGEVPPDFRLTVRGEDGAERGHDYEAVILAIGGAELPELEFGLPSEYFFQIGLSTPPPAAVASPPLSVAEQTLWQGYREIARIYAMLAGRGGTDGRPPLDLYRPTTGL